MKKILIIGSKGMLGKALMQNLSKLSLTVTGADIISEDNKVDITRPEEVNNLLTNISPDIVILTAAYTDVDGCEIDPKKAYLVNSDGAKNVANGSKATGAFLIYISTDFVFNGRKKKPYTERDKTNPINIYGDSKLRGEHFIKNILDNYLIIRTSWLFGEAGINFVDIIIRNTKKEKRLKVVDDQIGSPTYTVDLAEAIGQLVINGQITQASLLNITNSGSCSWYEFAKEILKIKGLDNVVVEPIGSGELERPAKRPRFSILDNSRFESFTGKKLPDWHDALTRYLNRHSL